MSRRWLEPVPRREPVATDLAAMASDDFLFGYSFKPAPPLRPGFSPLSINVELGMNAAHDGLFQPQPNCLSGSVRAINSPLRIMRRLYGIPSDRSGDSVLILIEKARSHRQTPWSTIISPRGHQNQDISVSRYTVLLLLRPGVPWRLFIACFRESDWIGEGNPEFTAHVSFGLTAYRKHRSGTSFHGLYISLTLLIAFTPHPFISRFPVIWGTLFSSSVRLIHGNGTCTSGKSRKRLMAIRHLNEANFQEPEGI